MHKNDKTVKRTQEELVQEAAEKWKQDLSCPYLLVTCGPLKHKKILLLAKETVIGREPGCHVQIPDPFVSAHHVAIVRTPDGVRVRDLSSSNGTLLNGSGVDKELPLQHGDRLQIGNTELEVRLPEK